MAKFKKKPVVIDAFQNNDPFKVVRWIQLNDGDTRLRVEGRALFIQTLEGEMRASPGDWVIRGVQGEYYPCKPDIFEQTYELESQIQHLCLDKKDLHAEIVRWKEQSNNHYMQVCELDKLVADLRQALRRVLAGDRGINLSLLDDGTADKENNDE